MCRLRQLLDLTERSMLALRTLTYMHLILRVSPAMLLVIMPFLLGSILWTYQTGGGLSGAAVIGPTGVIYVGSADGNLYAIIPPGE